MRHYSRLEPLELANRPAPPHSDSIKCIINESASHSEEQPSPEDCSRTIKLRPVPLRAGSWVPRGCGFLENNNNNAHTARRGANPEQLLAGARA